MGTKILFSILVLITSTMVFCQENSSTTSKPPKRAHHELVYDESAECILLLSGSTPVNGGQSYIFFNDIWRYNKAGWEKAGKAGDERSGMRLAYDTKQKQLYSYGGFTADNQSSGQLRVLDNGEWKVLSDLVEMKSAEPGFVFDESRNTLIAFGGSAAQGKTNNTTWEWDGETWKKIEGPGPEGRQSFAMIYDSKRKKTVLYGGTNEKGKILDDGIWEFDGKGWKNNKSDAGPGPRMATGYAYDSKRGLFVIFGGAGENGIKNDTWGWDGNKWKKLAEAGPSPRMMGYMAYDKSRDKIIMFGGRTGWPNDVDDTWEWDGTKWTEK